mgnify:FL=1
MTEELGASETAQYTSITTPRAGLPGVTCSAKDLQQVAEDLSKLTGPIAIDAERASGFRYGQRAYLVQLKRGNKTYLIDPTCFTDLAIVQEALTGVDWILHAASQDLVCLAEIGLKPTALLFDTELAGRLLGLPRVGLGTLVESQLGFKLAKEHSAADWSKRPLPHDWLNYAALDVEFLIELWKVLEVQLHEAGKFDWALEEFTYVRDNTLPITRSEPWRRTSGLHGARKPRQLAIVRELWETREEIAQQKDMAPGRVLPDSAIIAIAHEVMESKEPLETLDVLNNRLTARYRTKWVQAVRQALQISEENLPATKVQTSNPPAPRLWQERNPSAFAQLEQVRTQVAAISEKINIPVENLMSPDSIRRILWTPPHSEVELKLRFQELGVRNWQQELVGPILIKALFEPLQKVEKQTN